MWSPTHVLVTVHRARNLIAKGKNGTNDAFVTIGLGKSKFRTSVKYNSSDVVEWHEECELPIPKQGNTAQIVLTALHRSSVGIADEFLGMVSILLSDLDFYERPKNRWYKLENKPGKDNNKARGELEVKVAFSVVALDDAAKKEKHKASLGQLSHMAHSVGGSLLSLGSLEKRKSLKSLAKSIGHKVTKGKKKLRGKDASEGIIDEGKRPSSQTRGEADPGVISEGDSDDDFAFDDLSHKSSASSLNTNQAPGNPVVSSLENLAGGEFLRRNSTTPPTKPPRNPVPQDKSVDEWEEKLFGKHGKDNILTDTLKRRSWDSPKMPSSSEPKEEEAEKKFNDKSSNKKEETKWNSRTEDMPKKEDEKEISKFARKFKNFRRDSKFTDLFSDSKSVGENLKSESDTPSERIIIGGETKAISPKPDCKLSHEILQKYDGKTREDLIEIITNMQGRMESQDTRIKDLEDYLDNLLVRVMETTPRILQNPYMTSLKAATWRSTLSLT